MKVCSKRRWKESITIIKPLEYNFEKKFNPHRSNSINRKTTSNKSTSSSHIGHTILGDPIYGIDDENAENYLNKTLKHEDRFNLSGSSRLWLHANYLEFSYENITYKIFSKNNEIFREFKRKLKQTKVYF